mmetsp:Transcript_14163/g.46521  ORF Transcript_14163/g.46521 Transcript_14163/m.46521 type:complete len:558 (-) Transcript_14163:434-2107(-)
MERLFLRVGEEVLDGERNLERAFGDAMLWIGVVPEARDELEPVLAPADVFARLRMVLAGVGERGGDAHHERHVRVAREEVTEDLDAARGARRLLGREVAEAERREHPRGVGLHLFVGAAEHRDERLEPGGGGEKGAARLLVHDAPEQRRDVLRHLEVVAKLAEDGDEGVHDAAVAERELGLGRAVDEVDERGDGGVERRRRALLAPELEHAHHSLDAPDAAERLARLVRSPKEPHERGGCLEQAQVRLLLQEREQLRDETSLDQAGPHRAILLGRRPARELLRSAAASLEGGFAELRNRGCHRGVLHTLRPWRRHALRRRLLFRLERLRRESMQVSNRLLELLHLFVERRSLLRGDAAARLSLAEALHLGLRARRRVRHLRVVRHRPRHVAQVDGTHLAALRRPRLGERIHRRLRVRHAAVALELLLLALGVLELVHEQRRLGVAETAAGGVHRLAQSRHLRRVLAQLLLRRLRRALRLSLQMIPTGLCAADARLQRLNCLKRRVALLFDRLHLLLVLLRSLLPLLDREGVFFNQLVLLLLKSLLQDASFLERLVEL